MKQSNLSLQEQYFPNMTCFGCGPANPKGLQLQSFLADEAQPASKARVVAEFTPWPEHDNGLGYLNGGIIATVLDCHSAACVAWAALQQGWGPLPGAQISHVTAGISVSYLRPAPLRETVRLVAEVAELSEPEITAKVWLEWDGKPRAEAMAVWKRWRPRG